jgi:glycosyltransferase involved in cell wall biosynthesis
VAQKTALYNFASYITPTQKGMFLVLHPPLRVKDGRLLWDAQACNGLEQWADNFGSVIVAAPAIPEAVAELDKTIVWRDTATLQNPERFEFVQLPWAYSLPEFLRTYRATRKLFAELIQRCQYLQFAIGGLVGDWAAVAALEARKQGRKYAIHADRVEHQVVLQVAKGARLKSRLAAGIGSPLMAQLEKHVIEHAELGLWHGKDCYAVYSPFCRNSYVIHDVHTKVSDAITPAAFAAKVKSAFTDPTLRICYAGRISTMKAPLEWVRAIGVARDLGVNLQAIWFGNGDLMDEMRALISELKLDSCIELYGLERDRSKLLQKIRDAHLMPFTHITPESPRCLIESLVSGTPIVGYESQYVEELTEHHGGGAFVPVHAWQQLGELIAALYHDRSRLAQLIEEAGTNGARFNDEAVFHERSQLIKQHLVACK